MRTLPGARSAIRQARESASPDASEKSTPTTMTRLRSDSETGPMPRLLAFARARGLERRYGCNATNVPILLAAVALGRLAAVYDEGRDDDSLCALRSEERRV